MSNFPLVIHLTDLHGHFHHLHQAIEFAPEGSLIAITGDLHNWNGSPDRGALDRVFRTMKEAEMEAERKQCHIAICSGNHDVWAEERGQEGFGYRIQSAYLHGDLTTTLVEFPGGQRLLVTAMPWRDYEDPLQMRYLHNLEQGEREAVLRDTRASEHIKTLLEEGQGLRRREGTPWIWLHHNPPSYSPLCGGECASDVLGDMVKEFRPEVVLCGHFHTQCLSSGGSRFAAMGGTILSNPGRTPEEVRINLIRLGGETRKHSLVIPQDRVDSDVSW